LLRLLLRNLGLRNVLRGARADLLKELLAQGTSEYCGRPSGMDRKKVERLTEALNNLQKRGALYSLL